MAKVLIVDDEVGIRELLREILEDEGYAVETAENGLQANERLEAERPDVILLDIWMPDVDGITLLRQWMGRQPPAPPVIMMSGHATIDTAVEATRIGAIDFLEKPISMQKLLPAIKEAVARSRQAKAPSEVAIGRLGEHPLLAPVLDRAKNHLQRQGLLYFQVSDSFLVQALAHALSLGDGPRLDLGAETQPLSLDKLQRARGGHWYVRELRSLTRLQQKNLCFAINRRGEYSARVIVFGDVPTETMVRDGWPESIMADFAQCRVEVPKRDEALRALDTLIPLALAEVAQRRGDAAVPQLPPSGLTRMPKGMLPAELDLFGLAEALLDAQEDGVVPQAAIERIFGLPDQPTLERLLTLPLREAREAFERMYFERLLEREALPMSRVAELAGLERTHLYRKIKQLGLSLKRVQDAD